MKRFVMLIALIIAVVMIIFVVGIACDTCELHLDLDTLQAAAQDTVFGGDELDPTKIRGIALNPLTCPHVLSQIVNLPENTICQYRIQVPVRNILGKTFPGIGILTFKLNQGICMRAELNNAADDALRVELFIIDDTRPVTIFDDTSCHQPDNPTLTVFEQAGDLLILECLQAGDNHKNCVVTLNNEAD